MALSCELKIVRAKNIELKSNESLFVRCYLSAGNNTRIKLNTHEITSNSHLYWNQIFSLECFGNKSICNTLYQSYVVFELRRRVTVPIFGKISKSILLGRSEVPWKNVFETKGMEIEKWVFMNVKKRWISDDVKPPAIQVAMKLAGVLAAEEAAPMMWQRQRVAEYHGECSCNSCGNCDMFENLH